MTPDTRIAEALERIADALEDISIGRMHGPEAAAKQLQQRLAARQRKEST